VSRPHRKEWTREEILACGLSWAEEFEEPPTSAEWGAGLKARIARAQAKLDLLAAKRDFHKHGGFPSVSAVRNHFGDWQQFVAALGFTPAEGKPTAQQTATRRYEAQVLNQLGDVHVRLLYIIKRGGIRIDEQELERQATLKHLPDGWGEDLEDMIISGYVERATVYRLTDKGRAELQERAQFFDTQFPDLSSIT
jgi:hypothetical protein